MLCSRQLIVERVVELRLHRLLQRKSFQVRGQISLSISLHCLRVTPLQATLTQSGASKPRDTQSETHNSSERLPPAFPHSKRQ